MRMIEFLAPPLLGGIIALSTNWLAIKMLFRPHQAKYIFGIKVPFTPGLIPRERARLTQKLAQAIGTRLLNPQVLMGTFKDPSRWPIPNITVKELLEKLDLPHLQADALPVKTKKLASLLIDKLLDKLKDKQTLAQDQNHPPLTIPEEIDQALAQLVYNVIDESIGGFAKIFISKEKIYHSIKTNILTYLSTPANYPFIEEKIHQAIDHIFQQSVVQQQLQQLYHRNLKEEIGNILSGGHAPQTNKEMEVIDANPQKKHVVAYVLEHIAKYLAHAMPIEDMIQNQLKSFDMAEAEDLILTIAGRELRLIIWLGGLLGFIIGGLSLLL